MFASSKNRRTPHTVKGFKNNILMVRMKGLEYLGIASDKHLWTAFWELRGK